MPKPSTADASRLSREDWVEGAILFLSEHSVDSLRLDVLSAQLGVTKGSFYWHFTSREQLLEAVLDIWSERHTRDIDVWLKSAVGTPAGQIKRLLRIGISSRLDVPGGPLELTLRDWARRDPKVRATVDRVDDERIGILRNLYMRAGLEAEDARAYALMHMTFVIGGRMMLFSGEPDAIDRRREIGERYLVPNASDFNNRG